MKLPLFPRTQITHPPEYKGKPKLYPIVYPPQPLMKASFKQLKQMFPNTNEHDHVLKWAADNIKHNDLQALYLRHYKQNPQVHTEENKNKLGHINGMMGISSEMKNVKIDKNDTLESAFKKYDDAEHTWRQGNGVRYIEAEGKPVVDFGDGWAWFDLGRPTCGKEGAAMGHCGNTGDPHPDDRILSLRKIVKVGDKIFHEPALTFINNHGWLGEMKGRANSKPAQSYHKRIVELLKHPDIKGMVGAGYMPENNFHFDDLSPEHKNQVRMSNPNLVDLRSDDWDEKQKIFASDSVPKIEKYQHTVKDIFQGKRLKEGLDSGKINIDDLGANDLRLLTNHRLFQKEHLFKLINNARDIYDPRTYAQALMAAKNSKHLDDESINHWVNYQTESAAQVLGNKLNANHIQTIAENDPWAAAEYLKDHHLFNANHIQTIAENAPETAAKYFKDHHLFNASHIQTIAEKDPSAAAKNLKDHHLFNAQHIQAIAEKIPSEAARFFRKHPLLNEQHINTIVEKDPSAAAEYLKDHPLLNANHIQTIVQYAPKAAAIHFYDRPLLNANHIQTIAEKDPTAAIIYLNDHPLLNERHINTIVEKDPSTVASNLYKHPALNAQHIQVIAKKAPNQAIEFLSDHHLFNAQHIQAIAEKIPSEAARFFRKHPLLNEQHINTIVENDPQAAAEYLSKHPLLNEKHIQIIAQKDPWAALHYLNQNPIYRAKYGNKVQKSLQKTQQLEKVLVSSEPSEGVLKIAKYDGMRPNETHVSTTRVPHERFGSVYVHHFESDDGTNARHLVSMHHDPHQSGVSVLLAARQNENEPMTVYAAATHPDFQGNKLNYVALREAVKSHGTLYSDVMQSMPAFKNWNRLKQEAGFKVNITKPYREPSAEDASMLPHIAQYSKQAERKEGLEKGAKGDWEKEGYFFKIIEHEEHPDFGGEALEIQAHHPKFGHIGGTLIRCGESGEYEPSMTEILPKHRRKGLASEMYRLAERHLGYSLYPNSFQSKAAQKLWEQPKRRFGKSQDMEKSKNVREKTRNISEEERAKRLLTYAKKMGLTPATKPRDEEAELPKTSTGSKFYFNPQDELFPPEHEIGHAMLTPKEESLSNYMKRISESPTQQAHKDELINHALELKIARRAGVSPRPVVPPPELYADAGEQKPSKMSIKEALAPYQEKAQSVVSEFDEGRRFGKKGLSTVRSAIDAKINARAKAKFENMEKSVSPEQQKENIKKQRQLKNKEIIAKLKSKVVDKAPAQEASIQPRLLMSEDDSPAGIPIYLKTHPSHDNLVGVHVHIDKLPNLENYGILDEPKVDRAMDTADARDHSAVYVSVDQTDEPKKPKLQLVKSKLAKALLTKPPQVEHGQYAQPFSMGGTKQEKKTIYSHFDHPEHANFNAQEHLDAYWRHQNKIKQTPEMEPSLVNFHKKQAQMHWDKSRDLVDKGDTSRQIG